MEIINRKKTPITMGLVTTLLETYNKNKNKLSIGNTFDDFLQIIIKSNNLDTKLPPRIMSDEMKREIIYHPYHMFVNGDIHDFISETTKKHFTPF